MLWKEYNRIKNEYRNRTMEELRESRKRVCDGYISVVTEHPSEYLDSPNYTYMLDDMGNTICAFAETIADRMIADPLYYYCLRVDNYKEVMACRVVVEW